MKRVSSPVILLSVVFLFLEGTRFCFCGDSRFGCIEEERRALLKLKQSFQDPSNRLASWTGEGCCHWRGVGCNESTGHVVKLDLRQPTGFDSIFLESWLHSQLLAAEVHPSLAELKHLEYLDLSGNFFNRSRLPEFVGSLKHLIYLNLSFSGFAGRIPYQLGNLSSLEVLDLRYANSFGEPNDICWASSLSSLQYLDMSGANLSTTFDLIHILSKLPSLTSLILGSCGIPNIRFPQSSINTTFLSSIQYLDLSFNFMVGPIPKDLNMSALRYLDISENGFNSTFPVGLINPRSLVFLDVMGNSFDSIEGGLFALLNNACNIKSLDLSVNHFRNELKTSDSNSSSCPHYNLEYLGFGYNQLEGNLPNWLGNLKGLKLLFFSGNSLSGPIPDSIGELPMLRYLYLSGNQLSGSIPRSLARLSSLESFTLSHNRLSGTIPIWLQSLSSLEYLSLSYNQFNGTIPETLAKLLALKELDLSNNHLNGIIPQSFGRFQNLSSLDFSYNQLSGTIPQSFGRLLSMIYLDVSHNQLSEIPPSIGQMVNLNRFYVSSNPLEGVITELHFANLSKLMWLDISSNNLTWRLESDWNPPFSLHSLNMSHCRIGPQFPQWLQTQTSVYELDLSNSNIAGEFSRLKMWISHSMYYLDLSKNQVTGSLPVNIAETMPKISTLLLGNNLMTGTFPSSMCRLFGLQILDLSKNMLSGEIPDCWKDIQQLSVINLSYNKLSGTIPGSLGHLSVLRWLHLDSNNLGGQLPPTLRSCTSLQLLDLGENNISGVIPAWVGESLSSLKVLRLRKNMLRGDIPPELCLLSRVQILDLALNDLSGGIPRCFGKLSGMTSEISGVKLSSAGPVASAPVSEDQWHKEKVTVFTKGSSLDYTTTLLLLDGLDLSSNHLDGPIPEELCGLTGLRTLNLSRNRLIGNIPNQIGNFKSLESFDLSHNRLSGQIPQAMSMLTSLNYLNLSYNNLSGKIPTGNQLQTLDNPSIYAGNLQLCGPPLTKKCDGDNEPPKPPTSSEHGNDDRSEDRNEKILFWSIVASGYATGLWTVFGILVLKRNWRMGYFRFVENKKEWILTVASVGVVRLKQRIQRISTEV